MSDQSIKPRSTSNNMLNPLLDYVGTKIKAEFKGSCIEQAKISFDYGKIVNIYIVYNFNISSCPTLENCLFRIGFDKKKEFFPLGDEVGKNVIIFRVDMNSYPQIHIRKKIF